MESLSSTTGTVALAAAGVAVIALLACLFLAMRLRRLRRDQRVILGEDRLDLVDHAAALSRHFDELRGDLQSQAAHLADRLRAAEARLDGSISKSAVVRYDAFNETTGRQSSTVALLDDHDNGVVVSAILQREQARVYAKPIVAGRSALELSPEESEAMERARRGPEAVASE